jgi:hypothetical protein
VTTIATDGKDIAADGLIVSGGVVSSSSADKLVRDGDYILAGCGTMSLIPVAIKWVMSGADPDEAPAGGEHGWIVWRVSRKGIEEFSSTEPHPIKYDFPHALGSGSEYARTAMRLGCSPAEAVGIAAEFDTCTGGNIISIPLPYNRS